MGEVSFDNNSFFWYFTDNSEDADLLYDAYSTDANILNEIGIDIKDNWQDNDSCGFEIIVPDEGFPIIEINNKQILKAHEFIRETFNLDNRTSISELPDLPISIVVNLLNNFKDNKIEKIKIPQESSYSCEAPDNVKPCRHEFAGECQYNSHCNFKTKIN